MGAQRRMVPLLHTHRRFLIFLDLWTHYWSHGASRHLRKCHCSKYEYLKHKNFVWGRIFNDFLEFTPHIIFLKIKTQSQKKKNKSASIDPENSSLMKHLILHMYLPGHLHSQPRSPRTQACVGMDSLPWCAADQRSHWEESWQGMRDHSWWLSAKHWHWAARDRWRRKRSHCSPVRCLVFRVWELINTTK